MSYSLWLDQGYPPSPHMMGQPPMDSEIRGGAARGRTAAVRCIEPRWRSGTLHKRAPLKLSGMAMEAWGKEGLE